MALVAPDVALLTALLTDVATVVAALDTDSFRPVSAPFTSSSVELVAVEFAFSVTVLAALLVALAVVLLLAVVLVSVTSASSRTDWKIASTVRSVTSRSDVR